MSTAPELTEDPATAGAPAEELPRMSFGDHLEELRRRLFRALLAVFVAVAVVFPWKDTVTAAYMQPYRIAWSKAFADHMEAQQAKVDAAGGLEAMRQSAHPLEVETAQWCLEYGPSIQDGSYPVDQTGRIVSFGQFMLPYSLKSASPLSDFWTFMAAAFLFALLLASPVVGYQLWAFVGAGLYQKERAVVYRVLPFSVGLFAAGMLFGFFLVVPYGLYFLTRLMTIGMVEPFIMVDYYFRFLFMLTAALGLIFQLPLIMLALQKVGLVTHQAMIKHWRYVILGLFVVSAVLTPPDPVTQLLMAGPTVLLYLLGLFLTGRAARRQRALGGTL